MISQDSLRVISKNVSNEVSNISENEILKTMEEQAIPLYELIKNIKEAINIFCEKAEKYGIFKDTKGNIDRLKLRLESSIDDIYVSFFDVQNLINAYIGQRIVMTFVSVDSEGNREIRVSDNTVEHLKEISFRGNQRLAYLINEHYKTLTNSLPSEKNQTISDVAKEVERRYVEYKGKILWYYPNAWKGYKMYHKGPINEAYVNFYVNNFYFGKSNTEENIDIFMKHKDYGAINADSTKGFLIGDVHKGGIQYAVKGEFGGPQGLIQVAKDLKKISGENFSEKKLKEFIKKYTEEELEKEYHPHVYDLTKKEMEEILKEYSKDIHIQAYLKI